MRSRWLAKALMDEMDRAMENKVLYEKDIATDELQGKKVAVLGYGVRAMPMR